MIETTNLTKTFGDLTAVDRLTLSIAEGEVFGFFPGRNGAGKTTTVRMLTSLIAPTAGTASLLGHKLGEADTEIRRNVGILTETPGMYERLSAYKNMAIYARLYEVKDVDGQVEKISAPAGLVGPAQRRRASGRLAKGCGKSWRLPALYCTSRASFFWTSQRPGWTRRRRGWCEISLPMVKEQGRTIFLTTHNLDEADRLCDRVAVFKTRLRVLDTPEGLRQQLYGRQVVFHLAHAAQSALPLIWGCPTSRRSRR